MSNVEFGAVQKRLDFVDLVKSSPTSIYYLLANIGVDTAENEPSRVSKFTPTQKIYFVSVSYRAQVGRALAAVGALGIIHRDVNARNCVYPNSKARHIVF